MTLSHRNILVKKGQIWVDKKTGDKFIIKGGRGDEWHGERESGIAHHITRWMLFKRFELQKDV